MATGFLFPRRPPGQADSTANTWSKANSLTDQAIGTAGSPAPAGDPLSPSLSLSNNSIQGVLDNAGKVNRLTGGHKRVAWCLSTEIQWLAKRYGIERLGFLTLTFWHHVTDIREAQRRFNSLNTNVLKGHCLRGIGVVERQKSKRLHFHLVVALRADIRSGLDFQAIERQDYRSANQALRSEWAFWRDIAPRYGFGRTELLPVRSTAEGIARYVGKYVSKHVGEREERDKGARLVRYVGFQAGDRVSSARMGWNTLGGWLWRQKLGNFAKACGIECIEELRELFGPRWAYWLQPSILATPVHVFSRETFAQCERASNMSRSWEESSLLARVAFADAYPDSIALDSDAYATWRRNREVKSQSVHSILSRAGT